jgi:protein SDA1
MMAVVSRMIGRHKLIIPNYYGFLQKYLKYGNKELTKIFAFLAEATHTSVP